MRHVAGCDGGHKFIIDAIQISEASEPNKRSQQNYSQPDFFSLRYKSEHPIAVAANTVG